MTIAREDAAQYAAAAVCSGKRAEEIVIDLIDAGVTRTTAQRVVEEMVRIRQELRAAGALESEELLLQTCSSRGIPLEFVPATSQAIVPAETITRPPVAKGIDQQEVRLERADLLEQRVAHLEWRLRQSNLHSASFLERAFTVWGHFIVAHLIIVLPLLLLLGLAMWAASLGRR